MYKLTFILVILSVLSKQVVADELANVNQSLDRFHQAAAQANFVEYFDVLASDAVFLGTDGNERWTKNQFKAFVRPYFEKGQGWLYRPSDRHVSFIASGNVAFFDEALDNESYGRTRGTGVLIKTSSGWKIAQYSLSIPLPNALAKDVVKQIEQHQSKIISNSSK